MQKKCQAAVFVLVLVLSGCLTQNRESTETPVVQYYTMEVHPSLEDHALLVTAEVTVEVPGGVDTVTFCLNPDFSIFEITDGQGNTLSFEEEYDVVTVEITPSQEKSKKTFIFQYEGMIYRRVLDVTWDYVGEDGCWVRSEYNWYPVIAEDAKMGCHFWEYWYNTYWSGVTLSSFWNCWHQSYWAGVTLSVEVPVSWTVISSGELISEESHGDTKTYTWEEKQAIPSLNFIAGEYEVIRDSQNGTETTCYVTEHKEAVKEYMALSTEILDFYSDKFGEYSFDTFSIVELPGEYGYASGKPSFVLVDSAFFEKGEKDVVQALGGAIAYQWWGNVVSGEDNASLISLEVCLSNYVSLLFLREKYGEDVFREYITRYQDEAEETFAEYGGHSVTDSSAFVKGRGFQRNAVILKTILMFHALKEEVGEESFFDVLRTFATEHSGESVTMETLKEYFEELTGKDLDTFFEQYYYGTEIPDITFS